VLRFHLFTPSVKTRLLAVSQVSPVCSVFALYQEYSFAPARSVGTLLSAKNATSIFLFAISFSGQASLGLMWCINNGSKIPVLTKNYLGPY